MNILSLDMATVTGWCFGNAMEGVPKLGCIRLPSTGKDLGRWGNAAKEEYSILVDSCQPDRIIYESPILRGATRIDTLRKLYSLATIIEMIAEDNEIPISEVAITTVKKTLTGNGRADKQQMIEAAIAKGMAPADDNEADSFGIWLHAARHFAPEEARRFETGLLI